MVSLSGPSPARAPPGPALSPQLGADPPELQEPPSRAGARPLGAALPRGLHCPPCQTRPDWGSPSPAVFALRPRALRRLWLRPGTEPAGREAKRRVVRTGARARGGRDWRGAFVVVSTARVPKVQGKPGRLWLPGQATRRALGVELSPWSWGTSWAKLEKSLGYVLCCALCFSRGRTLLPNCIAGRCVPGLVASVPPLHFGAVAQSAGGFLFHVYWRSFPRSPSQFSRPSGAPTPRAPSAVLRGSPHLSRELRVRSPLSPTLPCTTSLCLSGS